MKRMMSVRVRLLPYLLIVAALTPSVAWSYAPVEAVALFKDRAVVRTGSEEVMLKVGETSKAGVRLLQADPYGARVRYQGEIYELQLSTRVASRFSKPKERTVRINEDQLGQYRMRGSINGHFVTFLVDTGASVIAMSERLAQSMGLAYENAQPGYVQTAQGNAQAYFLQLDSVALAGIELSNVQATVIEGSFPVDVLLGMSFLNRVKMENEGGVLVLTARP